MAVGESKYGSSLYDKALIEAEEENLQKKERKYYELCDELKCDFDDTLGQSIIYFDDDLNKAVLVFKDPILGGRAEVNKFDSFRDMFNERFAEIVGSLIEENGIYGAFDTDLLMNHDFWFLESEGFFKERDYGFDINKDIKMNQDFENLSRFEFLKKYKDSVNEEDYDYMFLTSPKLDKTNNEQKTTVDLECIEFNNYYEYLDVKGHDYNELLLGSGDCLADGFFRDKNTGLEVYCTLEVNGEIRIINSETQEDYRDPTEYPEDLINDIKSGKLYSGESKYNLCDNNWCELCWNDSIQKDLHKEENTNIHIFDGEVIDEIPEDPKDLMEECAIELIKDEIRSQALQQEQNKYAEPKRDAVKDSQNLKATSENKNIKNPQK